MIKLLLSLSAVLSGFMILIPQVRSAGAPFVFKSEIFDDAEISLQKWVFDMINVQPVWEQGIFGKGIRVRINDAGVDSQHEEFQGRFDVDASC